MRMRKSKRNGKGFGAALPLITAVAPSVVSLGSTLLNRYLDNRGKKKLAAAQNPNGGMCKRGGRTLCRR